LVLVCFGFDSFGFESFGFGFGFQNLEEKPN